MKIEVDFSDSNYKLMPFVVSAEKFTVIGHKMDFQNDVVELTIRSQVKPKKQAIKDLGKAVNWLDVNCDYRGDGIWETKNNILISIGMIKRYRLEDQLPKWWPDELTE